MNGLLLGLGIIGRLLMCILVNLLEAGINMIPVALITVLDQQPLLLRTPKVRLCRIVLDGRREKWRTRYKYQHQCSRVTLMLAAAPMDSARLAIFS